MTNAAGPPNNRDFELTLLGPGYGECIVMHVGGGAWIIVDSCLDSDGTPQALRYLETLGINPAQAVALVVATHWHDDHIRGMSRLVECCPEAAFCCASTFLRKELLALVGALEARHFSKLGSGVRELYQVFSLLAKRRRKPLYALANRVIFQEGACTLSSLSPNDSVFQRFLSSVENLIPSEGENKTRIQDISPNEASVALWVDAGEFALLLGADLEKGGWTTILADQARPAAKASVFKVPHHGSKNADHPDVWMQMLESEPIAVLAPWRKGSRFLPKGTDCERILAATSNAYISSGKIPSLPRRPKHEIRVVEKTMRESGVSFRPLVSHASSVRLRHPLGSKASWSVELLGNACCVADLAAA